MSRPTTPLAAFDGGNRLFEKAVIAVGLSDPFSRRILGDAFASVGSSPSHAKPDELGVLLPEIERRLLLALPHETAAPVMARLRSLILDWEE